MRRFLRIILVIPLGLMAAIATAVAVYLAAFGFTPDDFRPGIGEPLPLATQPLLIVLAAISRVALLPFVVAVLFAEMVSLRSVLVWTLFGGALGLILQMLGAPHSDILLPGAAAGLAAGFVYWLIAGRKSGRVWR